MAAREGLERARKLKPDPFFTAEAVARIQNGRLRRGPRVDCANRLDYRSHHRTGRREAVAPRASRGRATRRIDRQFQHVGAFDCRPRRRAQRRFSPTLARDALLQSTPIPAAARNHSDRVRQTRQSSPRCATSPIGGSARTSSSRRTRRDSSPITWPCMASSAFSTRSPPAHTRSKRSMR